MLINQPAENIVLPGVSARKINLRNPDQLQEHRRSTILEKIPHVIRGHLVAWIGEFVGTFMFLFLAFSGTQVANTTTAGSQTSDVVSVATAPNTSNLLYVALAFGFSLAVNAWVFFRVTGGLFNPAVTLGMCLIGAVTWVRGIIVVTAQIVGAIASSAVVSALFPGPFSVKTNLSADTSIVRGLFIEMFLTAELVFTIFMLAAEKHQATFIAPIGIGLALFVCELCGVYYTGGSLNPARSFGPAVIIGDWQSYHWIYWVGPFLGALVAVAFYKLIKALEFETVNPGAEAHEKEVQKFVDEGALPADLAVATGRAPSNAGLVAIGEKQDVDSIKTASTLNNNNVPTFTSAYNPPAGTNRVASSSNIHNNNNIGANYVGPAGVSLGGVSGQNRYDPEATAARATNLTGEPGRYRYENDNRV